MCRIQSPITTTKPNITFYELDWQIVKNELYALNIQVPLGLFDAFSPYYYTTLWGIQEAVKYARRVYPFPKFKEPIMDCDDFATLMKGLISAEFGINAFGIALGKMPLGYHAYNLARVEDRWVNIEPQSGDIFEIGERDYLCDRIII